MDHRRRLERYNHFRTFYAHAREWFEATAAADPRHSLLAEWYAFVVSPGGRFGGVESDLIEIFYGHRVIDQKTYLGEIEQADGQHIPTIKKSLVSEMGATLQYRRVIDGKVACFLSPASSHERTHDESSILLGLVDPRELDPAATLLWTHWKHFMAYMQCTSLDASPSLFDRLRVGYLRLFKHCVIDRVLRKPRAVTYIGGVIKFALTIGLSGFLLAIIQLWLGKK